MSIVNEFFKGEFGKGLIKKASLEKKALDKDQYYDKSLQGPTQDEVKVAHPGGGVTTQVSTSGKGGEGVYDVKKTDIKASEPSANAHVETIDEKAVVMEEVARKEPKGVQGKSEIKGIAKEAQSPQNPHKCEKCGEYKKDCLCGKTPEEIAKHMEGLKATPIKGSLLDKLVRVADALDAKNLTDEANMIDQIIREETEKK